MPREKWKALLLVSSCCKQETVSGKFPLIWSVQTVSAGSLGRHIYIIYWYITRRFEKPCNTIRQTYNVHILYKIWIQYNTSSAQSNDLAPIGKPWIDWNTPGTFDLFESRLCLNPQPLWVSSGFFTVSFDGNVGKLLKVIMRLVKDNPEASWHVQLKVMQTESTHVLKVLEQVPRYFCS